MEVSLAAVGRGRQRSAGQVSPLLLPGSCSPGLLQKEVLESEGQRGGEAGLPAEQQDAGW